MSYSQTSIALTGVPPATIQTWLGQAQQALQNLMTGQSVVTVSYAQGEGNRSVTYRRAEINTLRAWIMELQQAAGTPCARRRPIYPRF
jgi:hypothetical protein